MAFARFDAPGIETSASPGQKIRRLRTRVSKTRQGIRQRSRSLDQNAALDFPFQEFLIATLRFARHDIFCIDSHREFLQSEGVDPVKYIPDKKSETNELSKLRHEKTRPLWNATQARTLLQFDATSYFALWTAAASSQNASRVFSGYGARCARRVRASSWPSRSAQRSAPRYRPRVACSRIGRAANALTEPRALIPAG
jgi:hypothetical protein